MTQVGRAGAVLHLRSCGFRRARVLVARVGSRSADRAGSAANCPRRPVERLRCRRLIATGSAAQVPPAGWSCGWSSRFGRNSRWPSTPRGRSGRDAADAPGGLSVGCQPSRESARKTQSHTELALLQHPSILGIRIPPQAV